LQLSAHKETNHATPGAAARIRPRALDSSPPTNDVVFKLLDGEALIPDGYVWQRD
jgi:hypothetical protein